MPVKKRLLIVCIISIIAFLGYRNFSETNSAFTRESTNIQKLNHNSDLAADERKTNDTTVYEDKRLPTKNDSELKNKSDFSETQLRRYSPTTLASERLNEEKSELEDDPPVQVLQEDVISPDSIFKPEKYTAEQIKQKFEASINRLDSIVKNAKINAIDCNEKRCQLILDESLTEKIQGELYDYYLEHPQFGKGIHHGRLKDDPSKIVYTFFDQPKDAFQ